MRLLLSLGLSLSLLSACKPGLDLYTPSDAKEYVASCARGRDDVYCTALLPTLRTVPGPVVVLVPNTGDQEISGFVAGLLAKQGRTLAQFRRDAALQSALARANIFSVPVLGTGTYATLDGRAHTVVCEPQVEDRQQFCQIDGLGTYNAVNQYSALPGVRPLVGAIYNVVVSPSGPLPFFPF